MPFFSQQLELRQGDITKLACDVIVNAANSSLMGGGGVDGAIHQAAGPQLAVACRQLHGCRTGEAKITPGFDLPAKYIIHTVGPRYRDNKKTAAQLLAACYRNSLDLAAQYQARQIAFPAIATGIYGYPLAEATPIAVLTIQKWLNQHKNKQLQVIFCCYDHLTYQNYQTYLEKFVK